MLRVSRNKYMVLFGGFVLRWIIQIPVSAGLYNYLYLCVWRVLQARAGVAFYCEAHPVVQATVFWPSRPIYVDRCNDLLQS